MGRGSRGLARARNVVQRISLQSVEESFSGSEMGQFAEWAEYWLRLTMEVTKEEDPVNGETIREAQEIILEGVKSPEHLRQLMATQERHVTAYEKSRAKEEKTTERKEEASGGEGEGLSKERINGLIVNSPARQYLQGKSGVSQVVEADPREFNQRVVMESYVNDLLEDEEVEGEALDWRSLIVNAAITGHEEAFTERGGSGSIVLRKGETNLHVALHEGVHAFANPQFRNQLGNVLDEGATELIAQWISQYHGIHHPTGGYARSVQTVSQLTGYLGFSPQHLMEAYFVDPKSLVRWTWGWVGQEYIDHIKAASPKDFELDAGDAKREADAALRRGQKQRSEQLKGIAKIAGVVAVAGLAVVTKLLGFW